MSDRVGVAELRRNISAHLERVKRGERLVVTDHNRPVAELVPLSGGSAFDSLVARGVVTAPTRSLVGEPVSLRARSTRPLSDALARTRQDA